MFLFDSFNRRKTEPIWFYILRCIFAIIFSWLLVKFSFYDNFSNVIYQATVQKYPVPDGSEMELLINMCASSEMEFDIRKLPLDSFNTNKITSEPFENCSRYSYNFTINYSTSNARSFGLWVNANVPFNSINNSTINNNQLDDIINSFYKEKIGRNVNMSSILPNNNLKLIITMRLHLSDTSDSEQECVSYYNSNAFYFNPNQVFFMHITPSITSFLIRCVIDLDIRSEQLPLNLDTNQVGLGIYVNLPLRYETIKAYSLTDYISDIGGFYSFISETFAYIFGSDKLGPWGVAQLSILAGIPCIRSFTKNLAKRYVSRGGIPFAEEVKDRPKEKNPEAKYPKAKDPETRDLVVSLEERVQMLETLLAEYYLDDAYLVKIKELINHHDELKNRIRKKENSVKMDEVDESQSHIS